MLGNSFKTVLILTSLPTANMEDFDQYDLEFLFCDLVQGYAYILTHPGQPCVFYDHLYEWGSDLKQAILDLVSTLLRLSII